MNIQNFLVTLPIMGEGMLGIFGGTIVMILVMILLNKSFRD